MRKAIFEFSLVDVFVQHKERFPLPARQGSLLEPTGVLLAEFLVSRPIRRSGPHKLSFPMSTALHDAPIIYAGGGKGDQSLSLWTAHVKHADELDSVSEPNCRMSMMIFPSILVLQVFAIISEQDVSEVVFLKHKILRDLLTKTPHGQIFTSVGQDVVLRQAVLCGREEDRIVRKVFLQVAQLLDLFAQFLDNSFLPLPIVSIVLVREGIQPLPSH
mmetsp:Transcript_10110/g.23051  ORF Transcript_10110/g.23051 Transcript_10110/m.23051 type:complete len:216 (-) Transcript_10110:271-918(-)